MPRTLTSRSIRNSALLVFLVFAGIGSAAEIAGRVLNDRGSALPYSPVALFLPDSARPLTGTHARGDGSFVFSGLKPGRYTVRAQFVGHERWERSVDLVDRVNLRVVMHSKAIKSDDMLVTASRRPQSTSSSSASVDIVTRSDMDSRNVHSVDKALESATGLQVFRSHGAATNSVSIRGSSDVLGGGVGNRVLLLIDGRPALIPATSGQAWSLLPLGAVERMEVVKGAFSALYGSNAMGGVVNLITSEPTPEPVTKLNGRYGFHEKPVKWMQYRDGIADFSGAKVTHSSRIGDTGYLVMASRDASDGHRQSSDYVVWQTFGKVTQYFSDGRQISGNAGFGRSRAGYPHRWKSIVEPLHIASAKLGDRQNKHWWNFDLTGKAVTSDGSIWDSGLYVYGNHNETIDVDREAPSLCGSTRYGARVEWQKALTGSWRQSFGADIVYDRVESDSLLYGDRTSRNISAFSLTQVTLGSHFRAELGVRYDCLWLPEIQAEHHLNPKLGIIVPLGPTFSLRASVGRAYRSPSIAERFLILEPGGGTLFEPNDSLRSEKMISYEIGFTHELNSYLRMDIAGFVNDYDQWIYWRELPRESGSLGDRFQVANLLKVRMTGVDMRMRIKPSEAFQITLNYLHLRALDRTDDRENDTLPYRPVHTFSGQVEFSHGGLHTTVNVRGRSQVEETVFSAYQSDRPGGSVVTDLHLGYDISDWVNVGVEVDNAFNVQYEEMARYRMPGRTWAMTLRLTH
jgi:outer membrane cobalamin receptor